MAPSTETDMNGFYFFDVPNGTYTIVRPRFPEKHNLHRRMLVALVAMTQWTAMAGATNWVTASLL